MSRKGTIFTLDELGKHAENYEFCCLNKNVCQAFFFMRWYLDLFAAGGSGYRLESTCCPGIPNYAHSIASIVNVAGLLPEA